MHIKPLTKHFKISPLTWCTMLWLSKKNTIDQRYFCKSKIQDAGINNTLNSWNKMNHKTGFMNRFPHKCFNKIILKTSYDWKWFLLSFFRQKWQNGFSPLPSSNEQNPFKNMQNNACVLFFVKVKGPCFIFHLAFVSNLHCLACFVTSLATWYQRCICGQKVM